MPAERRQRGLTCGCVMEEKHLPDQELHASRRSHVNLLKQCSHLRAAAQGESPGGELCSDSLQFSTFLLLPPLPLQAT